MPITWRKMVSGTSDFDKRRGTSYLADLPDGRRLLVCAGEGSRWNWSITKPGQLPNESPLGIRHAESAEAARKAAERCVTWRKGRS